jgi:hypothetical protein
MKTAELVKRLMDAGATSEVIAIAIQAAEEAAEAARPKRSRKRAEPAVRAVK